MLKEIIMDRSSELMGVTLADYIYPAIQTQYLAILTHEANVVTDGKLSAIHQMRVSLRRLRSFVQGFAPILNVPKVMGEKPIGKIAKTLGKVRDLDVLRDICKNYRVDLPESEQLYLNEVISTIDKRRRKSLVKVHSMLDTKEYQYFKLGLNDWLDRASYQATVSVPISNILPALLSTTVGQLLLNSGWWSDSDLDPTVSPESAVDRLLLAQGTALHSLRKQIKATRYLLELFPDRYPPQYQDYLDDFQQIHKLLGNIQDGVVLDDFLQKILGKRAAHKLPTLYTQIDRDRYLNWQAWQPIQARYQQPKIGSELQLLVIQGIIKDS
jgi:CHAD domain-containing protein